MTTDDRVLVLMPTAKDGERTRHALSGAGLDCAVCADLAGLCREIERGAGVALLCEAAVVGDREGRLQQVLASQPAWSDFPLVVVARGGSEGAKIRESKNATLVERPVKIRSLVSVVRAALRSRRHQYAIRDHLAERSRLEAELRDGDRKKDDFIALLAHELRNPLAPIRNGLQVLRLAGGDVNTVAQARAMMDRQLSHLVRLVDDLLDVSRISRNKMVLRRERVLLADAVNAAVETARPMIEAARHDLQVSLPPGPVFLDADLTRLSQILSNLLTNSAKYTAPGGRIHLSAERQVGVVVVTVRDNGIGIPADSLRHIFDMFSQVDGSIERKAGGLGIGLALVKGLVEMHGGTVTAESDGNGSTFTVRLPLAAGKAKSAAEAILHNERARRRVLVVDDNRDGAESLAMMLRLLGDEVRTAHDGYEAIEMAEQFSPQVILMDIGMPRLNGLDAVRRIRTHEWGRPITIIALTGWGQDGDRARSREAGCDGHLVKPVSLSDLEKTLAATRT